MAERSALEVGVKYCGGCNPRYDRTAVRARLKAACPFASFSTAIPGEPCDALLVLCGCTARCADVTGLTGRYGQWTMYGSGTEEEAATFLRVAAQQKRSNAMDWKTIYDQRTVTAQEAVTHIKSGHRVVVAHACGEPTHILDAMLQNAAAYEDVEIVHMVAMGKCEYCKPEYSRNFRHNTFFVGGGSRDAIADGRGDFTPSFFFEVPRLFEKAMPVDVALVTVTPPDAGGRCSLGVSVDYTLAAVKQAKYVIAQVNSKMPWTNGTSTVSVEDIDCFVPFDAPIIPLQPPKIGPVEEAIGRNVASLVEDGSTLQLGIGTIPDAVLKFLGDKKDLGIHSEMFSDGVVDLYQKGVITGANKRLDKGKMVAAFLMGSKKLYDFVDDNPDVLMRTVDYVNTPAVICQNPKVVSINSCLQVDFNGQVNSESMGTKQFSGIGGQLDYVRGAAMCPDGKAILAMPSTAKHGEVSRIVPVFEPGTTVTTTRTDVHYIVTEYGVANLRAKSLRERARLLINIAHPKFRDQLWEAYYERYGKEDQ